MLGSGIIKGSLVEDIEKRVSAGVLSRPSYFFMGSKSTLLSNCSLLDK
jgi:hypothetical protein